MKTITFTNSNNALQYLADLTGKRVRISSFQNISDLKRYLKEKHLDVADYAYELLKWEGAPHLLKKANSSLDEWKKAIDDGDWDAIYEISDKIFDNMSERDRDEFADYLSYFHSADAPSWAHMDVQGYILPSNEWLIHFSNNAEDIKYSGFQKGMDDLRRLGLTTHFTDEAKKFGGYNFAFIADSKDAALAAKNGKYGNEAVMFKGTGIQVYHFGDNEYQVIFYGKDINTDNMILLKRDDEDWIVVGGRRGELFRGDFQEVESWVEKNYQQYRKPLKVAKN